jgi:hypothetical protein
MSTDFTMDKLLPVCNGLSGHNWEMDYGVMCTNQTKFSLYNSALQIYQMVQ